MHGTGLPSAEAQVVTPASDTIRICILALSRRFIPTPNVRLAYVTGIVDSGGDTLLLPDRRRFSEAVNRYYPANRYAAGHSFVINNDPITFASRRFIKFGLPRIIEPLDLRHIGSYRSVPVFAAVGTQEQPDVLYVPLRPGCEFQPYQYEVPTRTRGW